MSNESKLPKWAQAELDRLRNEIIYHKDRIRQVLNTDEDTDTCIERYEDAPLNLPNGSRVKFRVKNADPNAIASEAQVWMTVCTKGDEIEVHYQGGSGAIAVIPSSSNVIKVKGGIPW